MFSQLPCFGVYTTSSRSINRLASDGSNASYSDANACVFRLSITSVTRSARGYCTSSSVRTCAAQSHFVRRPVTVTRRRPAIGSQNMNTLAVPFRSYS